MRLAAQTGLLPLRAKTVLYRRKSAPCAFDRHRQARRTTMSERAGNGERSKIYSSDRDENGYTRKLVRCTAGGGSSADELGANGTATRLEEIYVKLAVIGDANVGKTTLLTRFLHDRFEEKRRATEGIDCRTVWLKSNHPAYDRKTHLTLVDTAGQERYSAIVPQMFSGAQGIFLVFDATNEKSFERVCNYWLDMVLRRNPTCVCMLVATKCDLYIDLPPERRWMDKLDMHKQARLLNCAGGFHACSAKVGAHINAMIVEMVDLAMEHELKLLESNPSVMETRSGVINISSASFTDQRKVCSC
jgi:small GTP-binding protein